MRFTADLLLSSAEREFSGFRRIVAGALVACLLVVGALSAAGTGLIHRAAASAHRSRELADSYRKAEQLAAAEVSLGREYQLSPEPWVRADLSEKQEALLANIGDVRRLGDRDDLRAASEILRANGAILKATYALMNAVDQGASHYAQVALAGEIEPQTEALGLRFDAVADRRGSDADGALRQLDRVTELVLTGIVIGFVLSMALLSGVGLAALRYQRRMVTEATRNRYMALHDALTGLPNRAYFAEYLAESLAGRDPGEVGLIVFDLDGFKEINDSLGHEAGDEILRQIGSRVQTCLPGGALLTRLGGDEFAVVLVGLDPGDATEGLRIAQQVWSALEGNFVLGDVSLAVETSLGFAVNGQQTQDADGLLRAADLAMYQAKADKAGVVAYDSRRHGREPDRLLILTDLRDGLDDPDRLFLHFQPKVSLTDRAVTAVEALVRWQHPSRGLIPPSDFIPLAEGTAVISALTDRVLELAIGEAGRWATSGHPLQVAVNVSARCLTDDGLPQRILALLERYHLPAALLRLEVTESALMTDPERAFGVLRRIRDSGIQLSVDDFGTGYSSMAHLREGIFDELKIDRSFVAAMGNSSRDRALVSAAIDLGHAFNLTVVAEGVETPNQAAALEAAGCDVGQGYFYARPLLPAALDNWLAGRDSTPRTRQVAHG